jgi:hypothetical protein
MLNEISPGTRVESLNVDAREFCAMVVDVGPNAVLQKLRERDALPPPAKDPRRVAAERTFRTEYDRLVADAKPIRQPEMADRIERYERIMRSPDLYEQTIRELMGETIAAATAQQGEQS